jgi:hypothetical protein
LRFDWVAIYEDASGNRVVFVDRGTVSMARLAADAQVARPAPKLPRAEILTTR